MNTTSQRQLFSSRFHSRRATAQQYLTVLRSNPVWRVIAVRKYLVSASSEFRNSPPPDLPPPPHARTHAGTGTGLTKKSWLRCNAFHVEIKVGNN
jgi:hypothetical protein